VWAPARECSRRRAPEVCAATSCQPERAGHVARRPCACAHPLLLNGATLGDEPPRVHGRRHAPLPARRAQALTPSLSGDSGGRERLRRGPDAPGKCHGGRDRRRSASSWTSLASTCRASRSAARGGTGITGTSAPCDCRQTVRGWPAHRCTAVTSLSRTPDGHVGCDGLAGAPWPAVPAARGRSTTRSRGVRSAARTRSMRS
jgi:hypothetical protein